MQDVIYGIKMAFNAEFEALHKQKLQELKWVENRNKRIREITQKLETGQELWEPGLTDSEWPERLLTVDDSEVTVFSQIVQAVDTGHGKLKTHKAVCVCTLGSCVVCLFALIATCELACDYRHVIMPLTPPSHPD